MKWAEITKAFDSRWVLAIAFALMVASAVYALSSGSAGLIPGDKGLVFPSANEWISSPLSGLWVNIAIIAAVIVLMIFVNKIYNIPRTITLIYATFFAVMQTASPTVSSQLFSGTVLLAVVSGCMVMMFGTFAQPMALRRVFLVFFLLSSASATQYAYVAYLPAFAIGCAQMRILTFRTVLAALLGIISPWWILLGGQIITFDDFHAPHFISVLSATTARDSMILITAVSLTVVLTVVAYAMSLLKLMTYNARTRACNGLLTLITATSIIAMAVDFTNFLTYIPMLNFCAAFFLGHLFVIRRGARGWIAILSIITIYYALYLWRIIA